MIDPGAAFVLGALAGFALCESGVLVRLGEWLGLIVSGYPGSDE